MTTPSAGRPTFAAIDVGALRDNFALVRAALAGTAGAGGNRATADERR
jgi:hypothetical protein